MWKGPLQEFLTDNISEYFRRNLIDGLLVRQESSLQLADSVLEPDTAVVRGRRQDFRTSRPTTAELVVEVAVSNLAVDREIATLYAGAGVREYWIVLAEAEAIESYRLPENGVYQEKRTFVRGELIPCACVEGSMVAVDEFLT